MREGAGQGFFFLFFRLEEYLFGKVNTAHTQSFTMLLFSYRSSRFLWWRKRRSRGVGVGVDRTYLT